MKGWKTKTLGDLCEIRVGSTPSKTNEAFWKDGTIPWFTVMDIRDQGHHIFNTRQHITEIALNETSVKLLPKDSVLLCCTASIGEFAIARIPLATNQQFNGLVVKNRDELDANFLFYLTATLRSVLLSLSGKMTVDFIPVSRLREIAIPLPPLPEQQRIVRILDEAFEGIATAKANAEKNLLNARGIFEGYLESVFAKRGPGWVEKRLDDIGHTQTGSTPKTSERDNYGTFIPFVKPSDFNTDGSVNYENDGLSEKGLSEARKVPAGSALMVCIGATIGKCGYCDRDITTNQQVNAVTPFDNVFHEFVYYQMLTESFQRRVLSSSSQATLPIINKAKWSSLTIAVPATRMEQHRIAVQLRALREETQNLESIYKNKITALEDLKKSILQAAFTGNL